MCVYVCVWDTLYKMCVHDSEGESIIQVGVIVIEEGEETKEIRNYITYRTAKAFNMPFSTHSLHNGICNWLLALSTLAGVPFVVAW